MAADERTIGAIEDVRLTHLEAQVVQIIATRMGLDEIIAARMGLDAASGLGVWCGSDLCRGVELNEFGLQYLDASYLVDEPMAREGPRGGAWRRGGRLETGSLRPFPGKSDGRCPPFGR